MGGAQTTLWKGNSKGVGVKTKEPSEGGGGMDIFWNHTFDDRITSYSKQVVFLVHIMAMFTHLPSPTFGEIYR